MEHTNQFISNYENACRLIDSAYKCAKQYEEIHFWEQPNGYAERAISILMRKSPKQS